MKIGTDITVVSRIEASLEKFGERFLNKFLNEEEKKLSSKIESIAGYWASKEAISKALGCGIGAELSFLDITIYKDNKNAPHFKLSPKAQEYHKIKSSSLSISHDGGFAIAVVVLEL
jgi:holo-[acyl-carrier protein] synthase